MKQRARFSRTVVVGGAALALVLSLSGCGGDSDAAGGDTLRVLVYGDAANKVEKEIVATFNKTSKVKAVLDTIPGADYQAKLQTIINSKQAPDVFFNWGGGSIKPFVDAGLLLPLDPFIAEAPDLKAKFLPSVFNSAVVDGTSYGVPMRGTQPVLLFSNGKVLERAGVEPPKTWDDLLAAVKALKADGVTPIALGGGDRWPTLMWFEYLYDRIAGPELFQKALDGDRDAWASPDSRKALSKIRELVDAGAFGTNYDSVKFTDQGSPTLLATGRAGFELMGSWEYSTQQDAHPEFAKSDLGYSAFPSVEGGKGDRANVVGNTNNFYSVLKKTKHPRAAAEFLKLMYSDRFVKAQLAIGNLPTTTNTEGFLDTAASPEFAKFQYDMVKAAPAFQLSWDQAYPQSAATAMYQSLQQFFNGSMDEDTFIKAMQALPTS
ncbi:extracellular solute-binding protein [Streptomyces globisporus]|uniref:ABC transporter substrate-binding protein n=1 Tax=Streptomyces TaxID=1883 RepID=UPI000B50BF53|nr:MULTISPECIES: extracellular solute-binding protein [unclassified Streptomyces]MYX05011.1 extracellular solute-binding protein [Streptomyces sp. SID8378]RDL04537.1 xylobiose transport system substrate-binding protein [Streptomyces sp. HB202]WSU85016.1 extracellular solute-binding protein [Streptomyces globisporus]SNB90690.1 xylobiose transport system substrate-binding protein [Streptomyces sp. PgraA7]